MQNYKVWKRNFNSVIQLFFHLQDFSYSAMRYQPRSSWAKDLQSAIYSMEIIKEAIPKSFYNKIKKTTKFDEGFFETFEASENFLLEIFIKLHFDSQPIENQPCECPV